MVMLAFLAAVEGCQEHGAKPPEGRITFLNSMMLSALIR